LPILFETLIEDRNTEDIRRYYTYDEALLDHFRIISIYKRLHLRNFIK